MDNISSSNAAVLGLLVAGGYGLVRVIEILGKIILERRQNGRAPKTPGPECRAIFPEEQKGQLKMLFDMHDSFNEDGAPKWFFPASLLTSQKETNDLLKSLVSSAKRQAKAMEDLAKSLSK